MASAARDRRPRVSEVRRFERVADGADAEATAEAGEPAGGEGADAPAGDGVEGVVDACGAAGGARRLERGDAERQVADPSGCEAVRLRGPPEMADGPGRVLGGHRRGGTLAGMEHRQHGDDADPGERVDAGDR